MLANTVSTFKLRKEKNYYAVGGCGGNIAWHTENDIMTFLKDNIMNILSNCQHAIQFNYYKLPSCNSIYDYLGFVKP